MSSILDCFTNDFVSREVAFAAFTGVVVAIGAVVAKAKLGGLLAWIGGWLNTPNEIRSISADIKRMADAEEKEAGKRTDAKERE